MALRVIGNGLAFMACVYWRWLGLLAYVLLIWLGIVEMAWRLINVALRFD